MCSFVIDDQWLNTILPPPELVPTILIRPHDKEKPAFNGKCQVQDNQEVWCYPRMMGSFGYVPFQSFDVDAERQVGTYEILLGKLSFAPDSGHR